MLNEAARAESRRQARERFDREYGEASSSSQDTPLPGDSYGIVQAARAEWERSPAIRAEFGELERYLAFKKAEAKGLVKILRKT